jgi:hypothetical protein
MRAFTRSPIQIAFVLAAMLTACIAALAVGKTIMSAFAPEKISTLPGPSDPDLATAAADMVQPPFGTALALMADPRQLRAITIRGVTAYESPTSEGAQVQALRFIQVAAVLGYGPARDQILANFAGGSLMRSAVPAPDAVRYALDVFTGGSKKIKDPDRAFVPLARYFGQRGELEAFATHVVEAIRDDTRLQKGKVLDSVLQSMASVPGSCQSLARVIAAPRSDDYGQCPLALKMRLLTHIGSAGPAYREDNARRQAVALIAKLADTPAATETANAAPRVIPGSLPQSLADRSDNPRQGTQTESECQRKTANLRAMPGCSSAE